MGILPNSHEERLWKEDLGVEIAYVLIGNQGKMRNLCVCVYVCLTALFGTTRAGYQAAKYCVGK